MPAPKFSRRVDPSARPVEVDKNQLFEFPKTRGDGRFTLQSLVGEDEIASIVAVGRIEFTAAGDTGLGDNSPQSELIDAMSKDLNVENPATGAALFLNMGDVIYGPGKLSGYANKFYRPNKSWLQPAPGFKGIILGIPGNHDGEVRDERDHPSLVAFMENFCQPAGSNPPMADSFGATMPNQPGSYWWLDAPFLDLIGLYSNAAEDFGILGVDENDTHQQDWLIQTLAAIAENRNRGERKALVIATHHPPYSQGLNESNKGHPGSPQMLSQIDKACSAAGIWPDLFISGHAHNYQRYMRKVTVADGREVVIPYIIAGTGGIGSQPVPYNIGNMDSSNTVKYANALGSNGSMDPVYGYLRIQANSITIQSTFVRTFADHRNEFETIAIELASGRPTAPIF